RRAVGVVLNLASRRAVDVNLEVAGAVALEDHVEGNGGRIRARSDREIAVENRSVPSRHRGAAAVYRADLQQIAMAQAVRLIQLDFPVRAELGLEADFPIAAVSAAGRGAGGGRAGALSRQHPRVTRSIGGKAGP